MDHYAQDVFYLQLFLASVSTVVLIFVLYSFRSEPYKRLERLPHLLNDTLEHLSEVLPPDAGPEELPKSVNEMSFSDQMKLLPGRNFWLATVSSSLTISLFYTFSTVIGQILIPFGNT